MSRKACPPKASLSHVRRLDRPAPRTPQRRRLLAGGLTVGAHLAVIGALLWLHGAPEPQESKPDIIPMQVSLLPRPPGPADAAESEAGGMPTIAPPTPPRVPAPSITIAAAPDNSDLLSDSQLAGASHAGEGGGGGGCDTARAVQQALRRDRLVRSAVADADRLGKASMVWNGDWVRSGGQDGKGLAAVRQAILWEVGFSPEACRNEPMHGTVVLSLADGSTRFAIGSGAWRWSDLLGVKKASR